MRFERLDLIAFGKFGGASLDFSGGQHGLHLVLGANEAGKSTALSAMIDFLYGIHPRSPHNFVYQYADMRVGATLRNEQGEVKTFIRRKGNLATLREADDNTKADEEWLRDCLGNVHREIFKKQFGIGYQDLVEGGQEVIAGHGELAATLFAAGAGLNTFRVTRTQLIVEAESLYKKSGRVPAINEGLRLFNERIKAIGSDSLSIKEHAELENRRVALRQTADAHRAEIQSLRNALESKKRIQSAMRHVGRRAALIAEVAALESVPELDDGFTGRRWDAELQQTKTRQRIEMLCESITKTRGELSQIAVSEEFLRESKQIHALYDLAAVHEKALLDQRTLAKRASQYEETLVRVLGALGETTALKELEKIRPSETAPQEVSRLAAQYLVVKKSREEAIRELEAMMTQMETLKSEADRASEPADPQILRAMVQRWGPVGQLSRRLREAESKQNGAIKSVESAMKRLPGWRESWETILTTTLPYEANVESIAKEHEQWLQRQTELRIQTEQLQQQRLQIEKDIHRLQEVRRVPTEEQLVQARKLRDQFWRTWRDHATPVVDSNHKRGDLLHADQFNREFEAYVQDADRIVDRMRTQAEEVARLADRLQERAELALQMKECDQRFAELESQRTQLESHHEQHWQDLRLSKVPVPAAGREWLTKAREALACAENARTSIEVLEQVRSDWKLAVADLTATITNVGMMKEPSEDVDQLLVIANDAAEELQRARHAWAQHKREFSQIESILNATRKTKEQATKDWEDWTVQWRRVTEKLGVSEAMTPDDLQGRLSLLNQLFDTYAKYREQHRRMEDIDANFQAYRQQVEGLAKELPVQPEPDVFKMIRCLSQRSNEATSAQLRVSELQQRLVNEQQLESQAKLELQANTDALKRLCQEAGCDDPTKLNSIEQQSRGRRERMKELKQLDESLTELAAGLSLKDFLRIIEEADAGLLSQEIQDADGELERLTEMEHHAREESAVLNAKLNQLDLVSAAAARAEEADALRTQLANDLRRYARLRIAEAVLGAAMEQYRERHEGPVIQMASRYLTQLSRGSLVGLRTDTDERGQTVLSGVRPQGTSLAVEGMSEGLADQLYLALRLASLTQHLSNQKRLPLICDDLLIKFDDGRSRAALELLAEFSDQTQVIFFTHHPHLVDIARQSIRPDRLFVQELPA